MLEDTSSLKDNWLLKKENLLIIATFSLGMIFLGVGLIQLLVHKDSAVKIESASDVKGATTVKEVATKISIDIEGAVIKPGVYDLNSTARLKDALAAAGGLSDEADREYVAKGLNLAQRLSDGVKIYIPSVGEKVEASVSSVSTGNVSSNPSGSININSASQSELEALPGIGPVTAGKIIGGRPYSDINELLSRKIVGSSVFGKIKDQISVF